MFRRYRIVSRTRFITFALICCLLLSALVLAVSGQSDAEGESRPEYHIVTVEEGDTLWEIARCAAEEPALSGRVTGDVRRLVYEIGAENGVTAETLMPGMQLRIPLA